MFGLDSNSVREDNQNGTECFGLDSNSVKEDNQNDSEYFGLESPSLLQHSIQRPIKVILCKVQCI